MLGASEDETSPSSAMSPSSTCAEVRGEIPLYVGGDLESPALERLEQHLGQCPACREALSRAREACEALRGHLGNPQLEASCPSFWPGIRSALVAEGILREVEGGAPTEGTWSRGAEPVGAPAARHGRLLRLLPLAAAAAALFALGMLTDRLGNAPVTLPEGGAVVEREPSPIERAPDELSPVAERVETRGTVRGLTPVLSEEESLGKGEVVPEWVGEVIPDLPTSTRSGSRAAGWQGGSSSRRDGLR